MRDEMGNRLAILRKVCRRLGASRRHRDVRSGKAFALIATVVIFGCREAGERESSGADRTAWEIWADAVALPNAELDGWIDVGYRHSISRPAYAEGPGPTVCIDEAHFNYHTAAGIYWPFAQLLRDDGFRVSRLRSKFANGKLGECQIMVIANAQAPENTIGFGSPLASWAYPHRAAFTAREIVEVISWIERGGALLVIADHAPLPAAVSDLALLLGVHMLDGYALADSQEQTDNIVFGTIDENVWLAADRQLRAEAGVQLMRRYQGVIANPGVWAAHPVVEAETPRSALPGLSRLAGRPFLRLVNGDPSRCTGQRPRG